MTLHPATRHQRHRLGVDHTPAAPRLGLRRAARPASARSSSSSGPAACSARRPTRYADNADVLAELEGKAGWVWAFQTLGVALAILLVIFAVGLRRRLAGQEPAGSLVPDLAGLGLMLMAVMTLVGTGISTEMFHALRHTDEVDPDTIAAHLAIYNTMAWVWAGGMLTTGAMAVAGLRHGSVSRRLGRFAAVMTVLVGAHPGAAVPVPGGAADGDLPDRVRHLDGPHRSRRAPVDSAPATGRLVHHLDAMTATSTISERADRRATDTATRATATRPSPWRCWC